MDLRCLIFHYFPLNWEEMILLVMPSAVTWLELVLIFTSIACGSLQSDGLSGFHANTHIPVVVGAQMRYEITGDPLYKVT